MLRRFWFPVAFLIAAPLLTLTAPSAAGPGAAPALSRAQLKRLLAVRDWDVMVTFKATEQTSAPMFDASLDVTATATVTLKSGNCPPGMWAAGFATPCGRGTLACRATYHPHTRPAGFGRSYEVQGSGGPDTAQGALFIEGSQGRYRLSVQAHYPGVHTRPPGEGGGIDVAGLTFQVPAHPELENVTMGEDLSFVHGSLPAEGDTISGSCVQEFVVPPFCGKYEMPPRARMGVQWVIRPAMK
jgi:hypothetical protein